MTTTLALLRQPRSVVVGRGVRRLLPDYLPIGASRVLVVTDSRMAAEPDFVELTRLLGAHGATVELTRSVQPDVPAEDVVTAASDIDALPDVIVAVGGGSVMDFGKVLAVLIAHGGVPEDYYGEFAVPGPTVPLIAIPTTAGTGSEVSPVAVVTAQNHAMKVGISSPHLIPFAALCDAELTFSTPPELTAISGVDALAHCIESFTAVRREYTVTLPIERVFVGKSALGDAYALEGIRAVGRGLRTAVLGPHDAPTTQHARDDMMLAALAGGLAFGTGGTAAAHALQYPIGALTHTPHGAGIAALLPFAMAFNRPARVEEFALVAAALGVPDNGDAVDMSYRAIEAVQALVSDVGAPRTIAQLGVTKDALGGIAEAAYAAKRLVDNNPRQLTPESLEMIALAAYQGDVELLLEGSVTA